MSSTKFISDKNKNLLLGEYFDKVFPYLVDFINKIKETNIMHKTQLRLKTKTLNLQRMLMQKEKCF